MYLPSGFDCFHLIDDILVSAFIVALSIIDVFQHLKFKLRHDTATLTPSPRRMMKGRMARNHFIPCRYCGTMLKRNKSVKAAS